MPKSHIKSHDTTVAVDRSRSQLEKLLTRYGCSHFGSSSDFEKGEFTVFFKVRNTPADREASIPIKLSVKVADVMRAMQRDGYRPTKEQAERVAWRNLYLWVDAACSAAAVGLRPMAESFFADIVVTDGDGGSMRAFDLVGPMIEQKLLPRPA